MLQVKKFFILGISLLTPFVLLGQAFPEMTRTIYRIEIKDLLTVSDTMIVEEKRDTLENVLEEREVKPFNKLLKNEEINAHDTIVAQNLSYKFIDSTKTTETYYWGKLIKTSRTQNFHSKKGDLKKVIIWDNNLITQTLKTDTYYYKNGICIQIIQKITDAKDKNIYKKTIEFYPDGIKKYVDEKYFIEPFKSTRTNYQYGSGPFPEKIITLNYQGKPVYIVQWIDK